MGCESYEGAIGSYLFVCSSTGEIHHKLYASHEQFPAALFQFLVHVEGERNRCHEIYCDTFSANISAEVEEVAALFMVKILYLSVRELHKKYPLWRLRTAQSQDVPGRCSWEHHIFRVGAGRWQISMQC